MSVVRALFVRCSCVVRVRFGSSRCRLFESLIPIAIVFIGTVFFCIKIHMPPYIFEIYINGQELLVDQYADRVHICFFKLLVCLINAHYIERAREITVVRKVCYPFKSIMFFFCCVTDLSQYSYNRIIYLPFSLSHYDCRLTQRGCRKTPIFEILQKSRFSLC
jgi:hypothetical protein